jgi:aldose 1-epimerase
VWFERTSSKEETVVQTGSILPSGEQFELRLGDQRAVVTEVGATLRSYAIAGREFLDTFAEDQMSPAGHGQVLVPWPNRIDGGRYTFQGQIYQVPLNEPEKQNAIHGLVRWLNWVPVGRDAARIRLGLLLHPQPGYPFLLALEQEYALTDAGLTVRISARNAGTTPLPFGAGQHPYFTVGTPRVDETRLHLPARAYLTTNDRGIPTGRAAVDGTALDFREERPIGPLQLDTCFTDLEPDGDGQTRVSLCHPSGGPRLTVTLDAAHPFVQVYTGDTIADPAARRLGAAIEPMTCPANAFNSGDGLRTLQPGESFSATWSVGVAG